MKIHAQSTACRVLTVNCVIEILFHKLMIFTLLSIISLLTSYVTCYYSCSTSLIPTDSGSGYKYPKARLDKKHIRPWKWVPFSNSAREVSSKIHCEFFLHRKIFMTSYYFIIINCTVRMSWCYIIGVALLKKAWIILLSSLTRNFPFPHIVMKNTLHCKL